MNDSPSRTTNFGKWMALTAALLGWLFDGLEMGLFPLIQKPALDELVGPEQRTLWMGIMTSFFLVGAATGGVLFGWLGDRIGRVRSMMLSVLTYALVSGLCGFATDAWQIGILRFVAALGMGGEWSLGVALINEIWPDSSRAFLAGLIGAAANVGYLVIGVVGNTVQQQIQQVRHGLSALQLSDEWVDHLVNEQNQGWRFLMMLGAVPALLTFFIRWYVPESEKWERERGKGATSHWATRDLLSVLIGAIAACLMIVLWAVRWDRYFDADSKDALAPWILAFRIVGSLVCFAVVTWGYTYPVLCYLKRAQAAGQVGSDWKPTLKRMLLAATLSGVALLGTWGTIQQAPAWSGTLLETVPTSAARTQIVSALGAILGTIAAALLGGWLGRRITYFFLCIASFAIIQIFFQTSTVFDTRFLILGFLTGAITASFYGWLPLYLPEIFPTAIRATGQGFGFNFGRILAAVGVLQLQTLQSAMDGLPQACAALSFIYVVGIIVIWFVPETKGQPLPD
ncbi:MAG: MFS transporter [Gemmataceae bacterium]|nr:MFS transporter [Gemmataceae bacterium]